MTKLDMTDKISKRHPSPALEPDEEPTKEPIKQSLPSPLPQLHPLPYDPAHYFNHQPRQRRSMSF
jgi:hypothetical protein